MWVGGVCVVPEQQTCERNIALLTIGVGVFTVFGEK